MDLFEKNNLVYGILKKIRDAFRPIFDSGNPRTIRENELQKNLKPNLIKIKK
ncbi:hypothetical protein GTQ34_04650 [Muricauda sp. JGD-17]|uniref:Uncharacterized protein n=1 Tax=Flagellimonas ochracea TaxID=2696472 RepID=A0A964TCX9_9FLAO|nr:hypothetical protein [Allomuricauda ochracea]NAY91201.1 hypothetical protein [Allomuricauda ochracea]